MKEDIAIIGIGLKYSGVESIEEYWESIIKKQNKVTKCPQERKDIVQDYYKNNESGSKQSNNYRDASYVDDLMTFDYDFFNISPHEAENMDPHQKIFLECSYHAIEDSGYVGLRNVGVFIGYPTEFSNVTYQNIAINTNTDIQKSFSGNLPALLPARISYFLDLTGPAILIDTSCSSSLTAIHYACLSLHNDEAEIALAGGVNIFVIPENNEVVGSIGIMAPDGKSKTFDNECDGVAQGEGCGVVVLKKLSAAIRDQDHIYAAIASSAVNQDGKSLGITAPNVESQKEVLIRCWNSAKIHPSDIELIEAHGTATKLGDITELKALNEAFRIYTNKLQFCSIGSVKTNYGHTIGAAGIAGFIKIILSLKYKYKAPTINILYPNQKFDFVSSALVLSVEGKNWNKKSRLAGVSSFGISGTNCHILVRNVDTPYIKYKTKTKTTFFVISANSIFSLKKNIHELLQFIRKNKKILMNDFIYTLNKRRRFHKYSVVIFVDSFKEICSQLYNVKTLLEQHNINSDCHVKLNKLLFKEMMKFRTNTIDIKYVIDDADLESMLNLQIIQGKNIHLPLYNYDRKFSWLNYGNLFYIQNLYQVSMVEQKDTRFDELSIDKSKRIMYFGENPKFLKEFFEQNQLHVAINTFSISILEDIKILNNDVIILQLEDKLIENQFNKHIEDIEKILLFSKKIPKKIENIVIKICIVQNNENKKEYRSAFSSMIDGYMKVLGKENPSWTTGVIITNCVQSKPLLLKEIMYGTNQLKVLVSNIIYSPELCLYRYIKKEGQTKIFKDGGTYVFIGGMGRIGCKMILWIIKRYRVNLFILSRRNIVDSTVLNDQKSYKEFRIEVEKQNCTIKMIQCDCSNTMEFEKKINEIITKTKKITGIFNLAVSDTQQSISDIDINKFSESFKSKINSSMNLLKFINRKEIENIILFSSVMSMVGATNNASYTLTNAWQNGFSYEVDNDKLIVINWPEFSDVNLNDYEITEITKSLFLPQKVNACMNYLEVLASADTSGKVIIAGEFNNTKKVLLMKDFFPFSLETSITTKTLEDNQKTVSYDAFKNTYVEIEIESKNRNIFTDLEMKIAKAFSKILGHSKIDVGEKFINLGGDSISAMQIAVELKNDNIVIMANDILKLQTIEKIACKLGG